MTEPTEPTEVPETRRDRRGMLIVAGVATLAAVGAIVGTQSGAHQAKVRWSDDPRPAAQPTPAAKPAPVRSADSDAFASGGADEVRGMIKAKNEATIASRITARITAMPYREGKSFHKGALLASFDCSQAEAQLTAARAAAAAYRKTYETNAELDQYNAVGKNEVAVAQANLGKADAEANAVAAGLTDCAVHAPFAGTVVQEIGHAREIAASGQPLLKIQSGDDLEMELIVPSRWLTWVRPGTPFRFHIDETGEEARGVVTRFGASVDPVSKTIRVVGTITGSSGLVLPGMSGSARFDRGGAVAAAGRSNGAGDGQPS